MSVTYFVALPFVRTEEGIAAGQAQEMTSEPAAVRRAEAMSKKPENVEALAFKRTDGPNKGNCGDATVLTRAVPLRHDANPPGGLRSRWSDQCFFAPPTGHWARADADYFGSVTLGT